MLRRSINEHGTGSGGLGTWRRRYWLCLFLLGNAVHGETLDIYYYEREPFVFKTPQGPDGPSLEVIKNAAKAAGIHLRFDEVPSGRIIYELRNSTDAFCSPNWSRTEERERYARFVGPIGLRPRQAFIASKALAPALIALGSYQKLLADPRYTLAMRKGFSLGEAFDRAIAKANPPMHYLENRSQDETVQFLTLREGHYSVVFEDIFRLMQSQKLPFTKELVMFRYPVMPESGFNYMMCTRLVDPVVLQKLQRMLPKFSPEETPSPSPVPAAPSASVLPTGSRPENHSN